MFTSSRCPRSIGSGAPLIFQRGAADRGEHREVAKLPMATVQYRAPLKKADRGEYRLGAKRALPEPYATARAVINHSSIARRSEPKNTSLQMMSRMAPVPAMKMFNRSSPASYRSQTNCTAAMTPAGVVGIVVAKAVAASCNSSWSSVSRRCVPLAAGSLSSRDARVQNCQSRGQAPQDVPMCACIVRLCRKLHHASWSVSPLLELLQSSRVQSLAPPAQLLLRQPP